MAVAALVVSVFALVVSAASAWYSRRQTHAAEREAKLASAEHWRSAQPSFSVETSRTGGRRTYWLVCEHSAYPLSHVSLSVVDGGGLDGFGERGTMTVEFGAMQSSDRCEVIPVFDEGDEDGRARVHATPSADGLAPWTVPVTISRRRVPKIYAY